MSERGISLEEAVGVEMGDGFHAEGIIKLLILKSNGNHVCHCWRREIEVRKGKRLE